MKLNPCCEKVASEVPSGTMELTPWQRKVNVYEEYAQHGIHM